MPQFDATPGEPFRTPPDSPCSRAPGGLDDCTRLCEILAPGAHLPNHPLPLCGRVARTSRVNWLATAFPGTWFPGGPDGKWPKPIPFLIGGNMKITVGSPWEPDGYLLDHGGARVWLVIRQEAEDGYDQLAADLHAAPPWGYMIEWLRRHHHDALRHVARLDRLGNCGLRTFLRDAALPETASTQRHLLACAGFCDDTSPTVGLLVTTFCLRPVPGGLPGDLYRSETYCLVTGPSSWLQADIYKKAGATARNHAVWWRSRAQDVYDPNRPPGRKSDPDDLKTYVRNAKATGRTNNEIVNDRPSGDAETIRRYLRDLRHK